MIYYSLSLPYTIYLSFSIYFYYYLGLAAVIPAGGSLSVLSNGGNFILEANTNYNITILLLLFIFYYSLLTCFFFLIHKAHLEGIIMTNNELIITGSNSTINCTSLSFGITVSMIIMLNLFIIHF